MILHILKLNGFRKPYCQLKWIFSGLMAPAKSLIFLKWHFHAKMAPDTRALYSGQSRRMPVLAHRSARSPNQWRQRDLRTRLIGTRPGLLQPTGRPRSQAAQWNRGGRAEERSAPAASFLSGDRLRPHALAGNPASASRMRASNCRGTVFLAFGDPNQVRVPTRRATPSAVGARAKSAQLGRTRTAKASASRLTADLLGRHRNLDNRS